jgi:hypothetical protein
LAGNDPQKIANLALVPRVFSRLVDTLNPKTTGAALTSFSDSVVVSMPVEAKGLLSFLEALAKIQLGLAVEGFFLRGGVTIGALCHDNELIFGPALNRAYCLESGLAIYPRILLDSDCSELLLHAQDFLESDAEFTFINPFRFEFISRAYATTSVDFSMVSTVLSGLGRGEVLQAAHIDPMQVLYRIFLNVEDELSRANCGRVKAKYQWIFDRLAPQLLL